MGSPRRPLCSGRISPSPTASRSSTRSRSDSTRRGSRPRRSPPRASAAASEGDATMKSSSRILLALLAGAFALAPTTGRALDWPMYGRDLEHTFTNADSLIDSSTAAMLLPAWDFATADAVSASPAVVDGVVYVGAWDGFFYALDAASGALKWTFQIDCDPAVLPIPAQCPGGPTPPPDR